MPLFKRDTDSFSRLVHNHFFHLTLILVTLILCEPLISANLSGVIFLLAIVFSAWLLDGHSRRTRIMLISCAGPILFAVITRIWFGRSEVMGTAIVLLLHCLLIVFLVYCASLILVVLIHTQRVTTDTILGAIGLYLIVGITWAVIYAVLEGYAPGSFAGPDRVSISSSSETRDLSLIYFSFVTQATLGYGDIVPVLPFARHLTILQTVIGQFYIGVVVAYLLSRFIAQNMQVRGSTQKDQDIPTVSPSGDDAGTHMPVDAPDE